MKIRKYLNSDSKYIVKILKLNNQYDYPDIEGPRAMERVVKCKAAMSFVAVIDNRIVGCVKAVYDGSRAIIHLLSVHPSYQNKGIGSALLSAIEDKFKKRGASTVAVTATNKSVSFWKKKDFKRLPVFLMLKRIK